MEIYRSSARCAIDRHNPSLIFVYAIAGLFVFQTLLVAYANSSYLEQFIGARAVSILYTIGAAVSLLLFTVTPSLLRRFGNVSVTLGYAGILMCALGILGGAWSTLSIVIAFITFLAVSPLIYLNIDVFAETIIGTDESGTGTKRGLLLAVMSTAALLAPLAMSVITSETSTLPRLYYTALGAGMIILIIIVSIFRHFYDPPYEKGSLIAAWHTLRENQTHSLTIVFAAHFLLQLFFTWAVIYVPLYLATVVGFSWFEIGIILACGLAAFVLVEFPVGYIADHYIGEKEMMAIGFLILAIATGVFGYMEAVGIIGWMTIMFISRVGASLVEATTESYFFKATTGNDGTTISLFRMIRPVANLIGAIIGSVCLFFLPLSLTFTVFAFIMAAGIFISGRLIDTR